MKLTAGEIACRACAAQPGEGCVGLGAGAWHPQRVEDAWALGDGGGASPDAATWEAAVEGAVDKLGASGVNTTCLVDKDVV